MHIISNALQAIKASDALKSEQTKSPMLHLSTSAIDEHKIAIWIADNGPGISPEIQDRIYEPFFYHPSGKRRNRPRTLYQPSNRDSTAWRSAKSATQYLGKALSF